MALIEQDQQPEQSTPTRDERKADAEGPRSRQRAGDNAGAENASARLAALRRHPWAVSLMASRTSPGPATLGLLEAGIRCFREGGFSVVQAAHAISVVDSYVHGFVLQEVNLPFRDDSELAAMTGAIMETFPASEFPHLFQMTVEHVLKPGYEYGNEFDSGLRVVLDGVAAMVVEG